MLDSGTVPNLFRGSWSKAPSQAARLALVLHRGRHACKEEAVSNLVSPETMEKAIQLTHYFLNHLSALEGGFNAGATRAETARQKILDWLKRNCATENPEGEWKDLRHDTRRSFTNAMGVVDDRLFLQALEGLQASGHIALYFRPDTKSHKNLKPGIAVNPVLLQQWRAK